jgi:NADH-quinone oxidoreductase subunit L
MNDWIILLPILVPIVFSIIIFITPKKSRTAQHALALTGSLGALAAAIALFGQTLSLEASWAGFGINFDLRLYDFSAFIMLAAAIATFLITLYCTVFMKGRESLRQFYGFMLLTSAFVTGAVLANNLILMLFFWEGLLALLFPMILTGGIKASPTAVKALVLNGTADLCLLLGVGLTAWLSGTLTMDKIDLGLDTFWGGFAFVMMMIGAIAKAGSMPFHSWIPDAAVDTPLPFMAFLPGAIEKLLGIYLLVRISMDWFRFEPGSGLSLTMMIIGACTILFAVLMALIQKDYKRLLSYHAVSQVGYMILGIGTALPIGIVGGLFHMVNNAIYKSGLFLTAGAVEKQAGTTDLKKLGGIGRKMPLTFTCFIILAASIAGVPPLNGFFSKELIFDAAIEANVVFYIIAAVGAFFTAASFLKLGHTVYFGKPTQNVEKAKEVPWPMFAPMGLLALVCVLFGVYNPLPLRGLIEPVLGWKLEHSVAGLPHNWVLVGISITVLGLAVLNHIYGVRKSGKPSGASDHIHYAPGLKTVYGWAEARLTDPYEIGMKLINVTAIGLRAIDHAIDWFFNRLIVAVTNLLSLVIRKAHTGQHWMYALWMVAGAIIVALVVFLTAMQP